MGHYTEFKIEVMLKADTPGLVIQLLDSPSRDLFTEHDFFKCERCIALLGECGECVDDTSYLRIVQQENDSWLLTCSDEIKNADSEIELFFDWLSPYVITQGVCGTLQVEGDSEQVVSYDVKFNISEPEPDTSYKYQFGYTA